MASSLPVTCTLPDTPLLTFSSHAWVCSCDWGLAKSGVCPRELSGTCGMARDRDFLGLGPWQGRAGEAFEAGAGILSHKCLVPLDQPRVGLVLHMAGA